MTLLRSIATVSSFTVGSRITGFFREMLMASLLGASASSDALIMAIKLPSLFRRILAEGAMNAAFVPMFSKLLANQGEKAARTFAEEILGILTLILVSFVIIMEFLLPYIMPILLPGFQATPERLSLVIEFSRFCFPFIFLISLTALYSGILNSYEKFAAVASSPMMGNIAIILTVYSLMIGTHIDIGIAFSLSILMCGVVQLVWVMVPLARQGIMLSWIKWRWSNQVKKFFKLMAPAAAGSGVIQLSLFIDTLLASLLPSGGISYIHYADRLCQLPLSVLGTAVGTALLPLLSKQIQSDNQIMANENQNKAIEYALLLTLPAMIGLIILAQPVIRMIYEHQHFNEIATYQTAKTLKILSLGLPAYVLIKVLTSSFFARQDTKTPVITAIFSVILNIVISLCLLKNFAHLGIVLATVCSAWVNIFLLSYILIKRGQLSFNSRLKKFIPRILITSILTAFFVQILKSIFYDPYQLSFTAQSLQLIGIIMCSIIIFLFFLIITKIINIDEFKKKIFKNKHSITRKSPS